MHSDFDMSYARWLLLANFLAMAPYASAEGVSEICRDLLRYGMYDFAASSYSESTTKMVDSLLCSKKEQIHEAASSKSAGFLAKIPGYGDYKYDQASRKTGYRYSLDEFCNRLDSHDSQDVVFTNEVRRVSQVLVSGFNECVQITQEGGVSGTPFAYAELSRNPSELKIIVSFKPSDSRNNDTLRLISVTSVTAANFKNSNIQCSHDLPYETTSGYELLCTRDNVDDFITVKLDFEDRKSISIEIAPALTFAGWKSQIDLAEKEYERARSNYYAEVYAVKDVDNSSVNFGVNEISCREGDIAISGDCNVDTLGWAASRSINERSYICGFARSEGGVTPMRLFGLAACARRAQPLPKASIPASKNIPNLIERNELKSILDSYIDAINYTIEHGIDSRVGVEVIPSRADLRADNSSELTASCGSGRLLGHACEVFGPPAKASTWSVEHIEKPDNSVYCHATNHSDIAQRVGFQAFAVCSKN